MTFDQPTSPPPVLVAIDIAKHRHEVLIAEPGRSRRRRLSIRNIADDHDHLVETLASFGKPVCVGFEPTGDYHRPLAWRLQQAGFDLRLISSMSLARTRGAMHNSWDKNDPKDAQVMLHMLSIGLCLHWHDPLVHATNDLQELSKTHEVVSRAKTEIWHRLLTHYLPLYFRRPNGSRATLALTGSWPSSSASRHRPPSQPMTRRPSSRPPGPALGRKIYKERLLSDIYETARRSIALPVAEDSAAIEMFKMVLAQARGLVAQRDAIEERAHAMLCDHPDYQLLRTIPGTGPINALREQPTRSSRPQQSTAPSTKERTQAGEPSLCVPWRRVRTRPRR